MASSLLEDFVDEYYSLPTEIIQKFDYLAEKDTSFEEYRKSIYKKRNYLLKSTTNFENEEKKTANESSASELETIEKLRQKLTVETQKAISEIENKISIETSFLDSLIKIKHKLENEMKNKLNILAPSHSSTAVPNGNENGFEEFHLFSKQTKVTSTTSSGGAFDHVFDEFHNDNRSNILKYNDASDTNLYASAEMEMNEDHQLFCYCRQISFGVMIACDNESCPIEWFHINCVGLFSLPKGKWFCNDCSKKNTGL